MLPHQPLRSELFPERRRDILPNIVRHSGESNESPGELEVGILLLRIHENGVSDIVFTNREHEFLTGTFDGCVRCFDVRNINKVVREYRTEGVIWRIVGNQSWD